MAMLGVKVNVSEDQPLISLVRSKEWICNYPPDIGPLTDEWLVADGAPRPGRFGVYVHVPFCPQRCASCGYNAFVGGDLDDYASRVVDEIQLYSERPGLAGAAIPFIYFGGGTPSLLPPAALGQIVEAVGRHFRLTSETEVSIEAYPTDLTRQRLEALRTAGVNRVSVGAQSLDDPALRAIGRLHTGRESLRAIESSVASGFSAVNADLMFGLPGQTPDKWRADLSTVGASGVQHISCYEYGVGSRTRFSQYLASNGHPELPSDADVLAMTYACFDELESKGFRHYKSQSSCGFDFSLPGSEGKYELLHVQAPQTEYIALGAGARGHLAGCTYFTEHELSRWERSIRAGTIPVMAGKILTRQDQMSMYMVLGSKSLSVPKGPFQTLFHERIDEVFVDALRYLSSYGLVTSTSASVDVTRLGRLYGDNIAKAFFNADNTRAAQPTLASLIALGRQRTTA